MYLFSLYVNNLFVVIHKNVTVPTQPDWRVKLGGVPINFNFNHVWQYNL